jgi:hypothetical protein
MIALVDGQAWHVIARGSSCADLFRTGGDRATRQTEDRASEARPSDSSEVAHAARTGEAQRADREGQKEGDPRTWRRAKAVRDYVKGKSVLILVGELDVVRAR